MTDKKVQKITRRTTLDDAKKDEMIAVLVRNKKAFVTVHEVMTMKQLRSTGAHVAAIWQATCTLYEKFGEMPGKETLIAELHNDCKDDPTQLAEEEREALDALLEYIFDDSERDKDIATSDTLCSVAVDTARQFVEDYEAADIRDSLIRAGRVPLNLLEELDKHKTKLELAASLTEVTLGQPFPTGWDTSSGTPLFTTGSAVLDDFMGGGWMAPECLVFLGTMGSCKTALTCHMVAQQVLNAQTQYGRAKKAAKKAKKKRSSVKRPVVVLIFTEGARRDYQLRLLSHSAGIPWKRLMTVASMSDLSNSKEPGATKDTTYEVKKFATEFSGGEFKCEQFRVVRATRRYNAYLVLVDCTDSEDSPYRIGGGGIPQIANVLRAHFRRHSNTYPLAVYLDHASALADRMFEVTGSSVDDKTHMVLKPMPRQAVDKIAKPLNCPIAIMHQLRGEANQRGPLSVYHHAEAAGSTLMAEYATFAVVTGPPDVNSRCIFRCTKYRREPPQPYRIVQVRGAFNEIVDCSKTHVVDTSDKKIISKEEYAARHKYEQLENAKVGDKPDETGEL